MGALASDEQLQKITKLVKQGVKEGAELVQPGKDACPAKGCFYPPTMLLNVQPSATVAEVEIFGPVVTVMTFRTPEEAVQLANNTRYGLAASIWSENINLALDIAPKIKAGVVWINSTNMFDAAAASAGATFHASIRKGKFHGIT